MIATAERQATTWNIDPIHTTAEFKVRHMMITNVRGHFTVVTGVLKLDEHDVTRSRVEAHIEARSIDTRNQQRDAHLRSADFFDVERHAQGGVCSRRPISTCPGSMGKRPDRAVCENHNRPQGLRSDVERRPRGRRCVGW